MSYHFWASHIHRLSVAQATAGDISAPLNSIVWVERDACESLQLCIWNHTPIPLTTRASLHFIKQCKVVQRPSAIFRCEGSKSITEGRYWDSWISTSSGMDVIMHLLSVHIIFPVPISQPNTFSCQSVLYFSLSMTCWDRTSLNINICGKILARRLFCIPS